MACNNISLLLSSITNRCVTTLMSCSNMVADNNLEKVELKGLPMFDTTNVVNWSLASGIGEQSRKTSNKQCSSSDTCRNG